MFRYHTPVNPAYLKVRQVAVLCWFLYCFVALFQIVNTSSVSCFALHLQRLSDPPTISHAH